MARPTPLLCQRGIAAADKLVAAQAKAAAAEQRKAVKLAAEREAAAAR